MFVTHNAIDVINWKLLQLHSNQLNLQLNITITMMKFVSSSNTRKEKVNTVMVIVCVKI
jgi:hypothetical protein